jgi:hypothetical protein
MTMQKIPTLFDRDWAGDKSRVLPVINPAAAWLLEDRGARATRKRHGSAVLYKGGVLWKRHDVRPGRQKPKGWWPAQIEPDVETGHWPGWVMIGDGPDDQWHRIAKSFDGDHPVEGLTYELCGPKVQGNPEGLDAHYLIRHGTESLPDCPRVFVDEDTGGRGHHPVDGTVEALHARLAEYLELTPIEGIVWWGTDGQMVKLKARDFGIPFPRKEAA